MIMARTRTSTQTAPSQPVDTSPEELIDGAPSDQEINDMTVTEINTETNEENTVTEINTDQADTGTEQPATEAPKITFQELVDQAAGAADLSTGTVPEANIAQLRDAIKGLRGKSREQALQYPAVRMTEIMGEKGVAGFAEAQAYGAVSQALASQPLAAEKTPSAPADPYEAPVNQLVAIMVAQALVSSDVPEGVDAGELANRAEAAYDKIDFDLVRQVQRGEELGEDVTVPAYVTAGVKIANGKAAKIKSGRKTSATTSNTSGTRRDLGALIDQALADGGPVKIADLISRMEEIDGNGKISSGAVTNRFWEKSESRSFELNGRTFSGVTVDGVRGAQAS